MVKRTGNAGVNAKRKRGWSRMKEEGQIKKEVYTQIKTKNTGDEKRAV